MKSALIDGTTIPTPSDLLLRLKEDGVRFVNLQFVDIAGTLKTVTVPETQLPSIIESGKWFDGSAIDAFARTAESDMYLWPDLSTYALVPWKTGSHTSARLMCWVRTPAGEPFPGDPRAALADVVTGARRQDLALSAGVEVEFYLLSRDVAHQPRNDNQYFGTSEDPEDSLLEEAVVLLRDMGVPAISHHHEVAAHQHEVELEADDPVRAADNIMTLKYVLRSLALRHGLHVTFMPKPWQGINGSGMHTHQRVYRMADGTSMSNPEDEYGLSEIAQSFIAGQLQHGRGMCALIAPLVNSYKRFVTGHEAPVYLSWARHNRSAFIRVPQFGGDSASMELRAPDPSCNPYLAFAVMLACGLDGIDQGAALPPPVEETLYGFDVESLRRQSVGMMPRSLGEALDAMEEDTSVQNALGDYLHSRFLELKSLEWQAYLEHVGAWEVERYLDHGHG
ncbi:MAG: type I glutamate--ammonia ligase [Chloroflexota bacterium]